MLTIRNRKKYAVKNMNALLTYNVIRFKYHGWSMEELNASIAKDTAKIDDSLASIDMLTDQCIEAGEDVNTAEKIADIVDTTIDNEEGISETSSVIIDEVIEGMYKRHGLKREHKSNISSESFNTAKGRLQAAKEVKVSIEGFFESIKKFFSWIWDKICGFFKSIKEFFTGKSTKTGEKAEQAKESLNNLVENGAIDSSSEISPKALERIVEEVANDNNNNNNKGDEEKKDSSPNPAEAYQEYLDKCKEAQEKSAKEVIKVIEEKTAEIDKGLKVFASMCDLLKSKAFKILKWEECKQLYDGLDKWLNRWAVDANDKNYYSTDKIFKDKWYIADSLDNVMELLDLTLTKFPPDEVKAARDGMLKYINLFDAHLNSLRQAFSAKKIPNKSFFQDAKNWFSRKILHKEPGQPMPGERIFTLDKSDFGKLAKGISNICNVIKDIQKAANNISNELRTTGDMLYEAWKQKKTKLC